MCELNAVRSANTASLFHTGSSAISDFHTHCLSRSISWCLFKANYTKTYKPGPGFPIGIIKVVRPTYQEQCSKISLNKCTHGQTQNRNEMFNGMIWHRVPTYTYVEQQIFETVAYDAVAHFSIGNLAPLRRSKRLGTDPGTYTRLGCSALNKDRV